MTQDDGKLPPQAVLPHPAIAGQEETPLPLSLRQQLAIRDATRRQHHVITRSTQIARQVAQHFVAQEARGGHRRNIAHSPVIP